MKNNKGFTLVELLVTLGVFSILMIQVVTLLKNTSTLYKKGSFEVDLQSESQRVIQVMEELLIDANVSVNSVSSMTVDAGGNMISTTVDGCNVITISNNTAATSTTASSNTIYTVYLDKAAGSDFGNLMLIKDVDGHNSGAMVLAEYVESISINMANYSNDVISLDVVMNNGNAEYSTVACKDIFLRNLIGSGGASLSSNTVSGNNVLNVLRFHKYNLADLYGHDYYYAWRDDYKTTQDYVGTSTWLGANTDIANQTNFYVETNQGPNKKNGWGNTYSAVVLATNKTDPTDTFEIQLTTEMVQVGTAEAGAASSSTSMIAYAEGGDGESVLVLSYCDFKGISVQESDILASGLGSIEYTLFKPDGTTETRNFSSWGLYSNNNFPTEASVFYSDQFNNGSETYACTIQKLFAMTCGFDNDRNVNALVVGTEKLMLNMGSSYENFISNYDYYANVTFKYSNGETITVKINFLPLRTTDAKYSISESFYQTL